MTTIKRKLIEVALPLEAINRESVRENFIYRGNPSAIHKWWAQRPLAACRAVIFAQLVDDPSSRPDLFPTVSAQADERQRLFEIIKRLVVWENSNDAGLLAEAHAEILKSTDGAPPPILDPFAGGGSIPLEAQRLGLEAHASDLNPVAVLINRALIEFPPKFADQAPVFPGAAEEKMVWPRSTGLAEDVRRYGRWMRDEALSRIGNMYPSAELDDGTSGKVAAWIWARSITCPNPGCHLAMPLIRSRWLGKRKGKEAFVVPHVEPLSESSRVLRFSVASGQEGRPTAENDGTVGRSGATCVACGTTVPLAYVRDEAQAGRMGTQMMAIVVEGDRRKHYLAPTQEHVVAAQVSRPLDLPDLELAQDKLNIKSRLYGMTHLADLFTDRQLVALKTLVELVGESRTLVLAEAEAAGFADPGAYADAVAVYLAFGISKATDYNCQLVPWYPGEDRPSHLFARQAIPMVWDYAELAPLGDIGGTFLASVNIVADALGALPATGQGSAIQCDAAARDYRGGLVSTDPPYYNNVGYANLSDFFYGWLRQSLRDVLPDLFDTVQTPKSDELVADPQRHGGVKEASAFFESGFAEVFSRIRDGASSDFPVTVFYAFKQTETDDAGSASTGWQTLLDGMLSSGWEVTATWPIRTERANRMVASGNNALASSIVLALRPRGEAAESIGRREFVHALRSELPARLRELQQGSIAPVDMAQAAIGPGMAVFSRYARVLEADGTDMTVRTALALINQALDEVLAEQEGDFDAETRFAVKWFSQYGWNEAPSGEADVLTRAVNTTVSMLERGGIFRAAAGKARLLEPVEMSAGWNPAEDKVISVWEVAVRLGHALLTQGTDQAAVWMRESASRIDLDAVKELSYLMYSVCERKGWTESAMLFNALGTSWSDVAGAAASVTGPKLEQEALGFGDDDDE